MRPRAARRHPAMRLIVAKVMRKIGVHSIVDLVRFAARNQLPLE